MVRNFKVLKLIRDRSQPERYAQFLFDSAWGISGGSLADIIATKARLHFTAVSSTISSLELKDAIVHTSDWRFARISRLFVDKTLGSSIRRSDLSGALVSRSHLSRLTVFESHLVGSRFVENLFDGTLFSNSNLSLAVFGPVNFGNDSVTLSGQFLGAVIYESPNIRYDIKKEGGKREAHSPILLFANAPNRKLPGIAPIEVDWLYLDRMYKPLVSYCGSESLKRRCGSSQKLLRKMAIAEAQELCRRYPGYISREAAQAYLVAAGVLETFSKSSNEHPSLKDQAQSFVTCAPDRLRSTTKLFNISPS